jgi:hypothetical protein
LTGSVGLLVLLIFDRRYPVPGFAFIHTDFRYRVSNAGVQHPMPVFKIWNSVSRINFQYSKSNSRYPVSAVSIPSYFRCLVSNSGIPIVIPCIRINFGIHPLSAGLSMYAIMISSDFRRRQIYLLLTIPRQSDSPGVSDSTLFLSF